MTTQAQSATLNLLKKNKKPASVEDALTSPEPAAPTSKVEDAMNDLIDAVQADPLDVLSEVLKGNALVKEEVEPETVLTTGASIDDVLDTLMTVGDAAVVAKPKKTTKKEAMADVDAFLSLAHDIENIKSEEAALSKLEENLEDRSNKDFVIGGILSVIQANGWFKGHPSLKDFVKIELGFNLRKAQYFIVIYDTILQRNIPATAVAEMGWSKFKETLSFINEDNVDFWIQKAGEMNLETFSKFAKAHKGSDVLALPEGEVQVVHKIKINFKDDQKATWDAAIEKVRADTNLEDVASCAEAIAMDFLAGESTANYASMNSNVGTVSILQDQITDLKAQLASAEDPEAGSLADQLYQTQVQLEVANSIIKELKEQAQAPSAVMPDVNTFLTALKAKHGGDDSKAFEELFADENFEAVFPGYDLTIQPQ